MYRFFKILQINKVNPSQTPAKNISMRFTGKGCLRAMSI